MRMTAVLPLAATLLLGSILNAAAQDYPPSRSP